MKRIKQLIKNLVWLSKNDLTEDKRQWIEAKEVKVRARIDGDRLILSANRKGNVPKMPNPPPPPKRREQPSPPIEESDISIKS